MLSLPLLFLYLLPAWPTRGVLISHRQDVNFLKYFPDLKNNPLSP